jgi:hypothetical protein
MRCPNRAEALVKMFPDWPSQYEASFRILQNPEWSLRTVPAAPFTFHFGRSGNEAEEISNMAKALNRQPGHQPVPTRGLVDVAWHEIQARRPGH